MPKGSRLVTAIGVSANDKYVVATNAAEKVEAFLFKIDGPATPVADCSINYVVTNINCHPTDDNSFATCGEKHVLFYTFDGKESIGRGKKGKGKGADGNMCSVAFSS
jgi:hypothetical protein